ncbi:MAG TPA: TlpA disulfide reductase family protein [Pilimelia sp.]|nr:TlpA disulfide reductase family protein [Pilimelia sp.]
MGLAGCGEDGTAAATANVEYAPADRTTAPTVTGELLDGGRYDLASARGTVVVVNFWGSWCPPCRAEIGDLEATYQATKAKGVSFLGINIRDDRDKARAFQAGRVSYPSLFDPQSRLALAFDVPPNAIPATIVLDRVGRVAVVIRRAVLRADLEPIIARVAAEPAA